MESKKMLPVDPWQSSNGDADVGNRLVDAAGRRGQHALSEYPGSMSITICKADNQWELTV